MQYIGAHVLYREGAGRRPHTCAQQGRIEPGKIDMTLTEIVDGGGEGAKHTLEFVGGQGVDRWNADGEQYRQGDQAPGTGD